jgi:hypothetical protein
MEKSPKYKKRYFLIFITEDIGRETDIDYIGLNAKSFKDAKKIASCVYGKHGPNHLVYKNVEA